jgi:hypothetical protein
VANAACSDIQLAQRRPPQQQLADLFGVDLAPRIFLQIIHVVQLATTMHSPAVSCSGRGLPCAETMCGLMQKCASPAPEAGLPTCRPLASVPKHHHRAKPTPTSNHRRPCWRPIVRTTASNCNMFAISGQGAWGQEWGAEWASGATRQAAPPFPRFPSTRLASSLEKST